jgi:NAD(P)-dependent dehydrogenase (short-subunit alcohol dehydrogenase family)
MHLDQIYFNAKIPIMTSASKSRHAFITGGSSGIGLAIARKFAANGHKVTVSGRTPSRLKDSGFQFVEMDVASEQSVVEGIKAVDPIDIFIANAGAAITAPALKTDRETWDRMIAVNLTSVYLCARESIPHMKSQGWGRFISIASTSSLKGYPYTGAYTAAKHGVLGWIRTLALEFAKTGVTANAICPGFTDTPLIDDAIDNIVVKTGLLREDAQATFAAGNPMGRLIKPEEIASAALWLASDGAASVNGQAIVIDGGETVS